MAFKSEMKDLLSFFKEHGDIKIRPLEVLLGLPNATIKLRRGYICPKHIPAIQSYLGREYGYEYVLKEEPDKKIGNVNKTKKDNGVLISVYILNDDVKIEINKI